MCFQTFKEFNFQFINSFLLFFCSLHSIVSKEDFNNITFPDLIEITDYLLVYQVEKLQNLGRIFPNLTLIRGQELFDKYAIMVGDNIDLKEIGFSNLAYTERGAVSIQNNPELCYVNTIDWNRITDNRPGNDFEVCKTEPIR